MPKRLNRNQRLLLLEMIDDVNSEDITSLADLCEKHGVSDKLFLLDWTIYSAGENMPGYLPESPYCLFLTDRAARGYCRELEREPGGRDYVSDYMPTTLREYLP